MWKSLWSWFILFSAIFFRAAFSFPDETLFISLQNYTGDRLNFGLAAEQAKSEGYKVEVRLSIYAKTAYSYNLRVS